MLMHAENISHKVALPKILSQEKRYSMRRWQTRHLHGQKMEQAPIIFLLTKQSKPGDLHIFTYSTFSYLVVYSDKGGFGDKWIRNMYGGEIYVDVHICDFRAR